MEKQAAEVVKAFNYTNYELVNKKAPYPFWKVPEMDGWVGFPRGVPRKWLAPRMRRSSRFPTTFVSPLTIPHGEISRCSWS